MSPHPLSRLRNLWPSFLAVAAMAALMILLWSCGPDGSAQSESATGDSNPETPVPASLDEGENDSEDVVQTLHGAWRLVPSAPKALPSAPEVEMQALAGATAELADLASLSHFDSTAFDWRMAPALRNLEDLELFSGVELENRLTPIEWGPEFQPVPGLPEDPIFASPKFDAVRTAFSQACRSEAAKYTNAVLNLTATTNPMDIVRRGDLERASDEYEKNCLTALSSVPQGVRSVTGVLSLSTLRGKIFFCSATIVADRRLLTARHCFFDAETGQPEESWAALANSNISFHSAASHHGRSLFSVRSVAGTSTDQGFPPFEDHLLLRVIEGPFESFASLRSEPLQESQIPVLAWVVGSNALLGDVTQAPSAWSYVRGSGPDTCAILAVTDAGCLYHSCQTGPTTSGAGLLTQTSQGYELVGVHKGAISNAAGCETNSPSHLDLNLGAEFTITDFLGV